MIKPDICIIGTNIGGFFLAASAVSSGLDVVLVDNGRDGHDHDRVNDISTKALLAAGKRINTIEECAAFGVETGEAVVDFRKVQERVHCVIAAAAASVSNRRLIAMGARVIEADAVFIDKRTVRAGDLEIRARHFVLACARRQRIPGIPGLEEVDYLTPGTVLGLRRAPSRLVIAGAGSEGMELAQAYRRLGCQVAVLETGSALGLEDREAADIVKQHLRAEGVELYEGCSFKSVKRSSRKGICVNIDSEGTDHAIDGTHLLLATGDRPDFEGLHLEAANVAISDTGIELDARLRTSNRRVHAIGCKAGTVWSRQMAEFEAGLVLDSILSRGRTRHHAHIVPRLTFTDPELAHIGLTEAEARTRHTSLTILRWPLFENDRAQLERQTTGFIKIIADRKGIILGVSIVASNAGELVGIWSLALERKLRLHDMKAYIAPYPTMGEIGKQAVSSYFSDRQGTPGARLYHRFLRFFG